MIPSNTIFFDDMCYDVLLTLMNVFLILRSITYDKWTLIKDINQYSLVSKRQLNNAIKMRSICFGSVHYNAFCKT